MSKDGSYDKVYLEEVRDNLGFMCQGSVDLFNISLDILLEKFINSKHARGIEVGSPYYLNKEGLDVIYDLFNRRLKENVITIEPKKEFWIGWALGLLQWYYGLSFKVIYDRITLKGFINLYNDCVNMDDSYLINKSRRFITGGRIDKRMQGYAD